LVLADNQEMRDWEKALDFAARSKHPDAVWMTKLFEGRTVGNSEEARDIFLECDDPRAICFSGLINWRFMRQVVQKSADMGFAFAQASLAEVLKSLFCFCLLTYISPMKDLAETEVEESLLWARKAADQGERAGFYQLGCCYLDSDVDKARDNFHIAALLGDLRSMKRYASYLHESDPQRYFWFGKAAAHGMCRKFVHDVVRQLQNCTRDRASVVYAMGRALKGHVNMETKTVFRRKDPRNAPLVLPAVNFFEAQLSACRRAVDAWSIIGIRNGVVKDIRKLIAMLIWEERDIAAFDIDITTIAMTK
jgi:hypothetical protein